MTHRFGALDLLLVGFEEPERPLDTESLIALTRITNRLSELKSEGILSARSFTNVSSIKEGEDGTLNAALLMESIPRTDEAKAELSKKILANAQIKGSLVSEDLRGYLLLLQANSAKDTREIAALAHKIVEEERGDLKAIYFGAPFIAGLLTNNIYRQLPMVIPLFLVLLLVPTFLITRRPKAVLVVLLCSGLSLLWWLALLGITGVELTATASNAALLILVMGALVFAKGTENRLESDSDAINPFPGRVIALLIAAAVALAALSRFAIPYLAHFGTVSALGMLALALCGIFVFIPLASFLKPDPSGRTESQVKTFSRSTSWIIIAAIAIGGLGLGSHLKFQINTGDIFSKNDDVGQALDFFDRKFKGSDFLQISAKGDYSKPANLCRLMRISDMLEGTDLFSDIRSASQIVAFLSEQFSGTYRIPTDESALGNLWFFLEGQPDLRALILDDHSEAMLAARIQGMTKIPPEQWAAKAEEAVKLSQFTGQRGAKLRLKAIRDRYSLKLSDDNIDKVVQSTLESDATETISKRRLLIMKDLHKYMLSDGSPFTPSEEEWQRISESLMSDGDTKTVIADLASYKEQDYPAGVAQDLAHTLNTRMKAIELQARADKFVSFLTAKIESDDKTNEAPRSFTSRAKGIMVDLLDENYPKTDDLEVTISGFPAVIPLVEDTLVSSNWLAAFILWLTMSILGLVITRNLEQAALTSLEAALATVATFGLGALFNIHLDSLAATLYLLPPLAVFFVSPRLFENKKFALPHSNRFPLALALGFAAAGLSLLPTGVLPVMRLGGVMFFGLLMTMLMPMLVKRLKLLSDGD